MTFTAALEAWLERDGKQWSAKGVKARRGLARLDGLSSKDIAAITQDDVLAALAGESLASIKTNADGWPICSVRQDEGLAHR